MYMQHKNLNEKPVVSYYIQHKIRTFIKLFKFNEVKVS